MKTNNPLFRFAFIVALALGLIAAEAKSTASSNSKGFAPVKFNESASLSSDSDDEDDDDAPRGKSTVKIPVGFTQRGEASYYGGYWNGRKTATGEIYNQMTMTAAHKTLPFNSRVKVRNLVNNKEVVVRINNRGPYRKGRIIDLSVAAATKLDMRNSGVVPVEIIVIQ
ncbi:MAG: hypothetical protein B9S32_17890 [Verrucomicrobia bacterium Tous-C9LFEB]|nr:MAG: hypothetical protein B9S32_17890 [Verrucomicrobia bacterium Tous-C9LFEB]